MRPGLPPPTGYEDVARENQRIIARAVSRSESIVLFAMGRRSCTRVEVKDRKVIRAIGELIDIKNP